jgi:diguanylate cyclase (GGDEF)-like protein/PAS domain S-box-containing protein
MGLDRTKLAEIKLQESKLQESKLQESEAFYRTIVELSPDAITLALLDGTILDINEKAQVLYGCEDKSLAVGHSVREFIAPEERPRLDEACIRIIPQGEVLNIEAGLMRADGTTFYGEISAKTIPGTGENESILVILSRDISKRKTYEHTLRDLAVTDPLTGLYNRRGFVIAAEQELKHAQRNRAGVTLLFFDVDNMKAINDKYGHKAGDLALKLVADTLRKTFRESDTLARWGGDEFLVLALDSGEETVPIMIAKLTNKLNNLEHIKDIPFAVSVTTGTSHYRHDIGQDLQQMIDQADNLMYENKAKRCRKKGV